MRSSALSRLTFPLMRVIRSKAVMALRSVRLKKKLALDMVSRRFMVVMKSPEIEKKYLLDPYARALFLSSLVRNG